MLLVIFKPFLLNVIWGYPDRFGHFLRCLGHPLRCLGHLLGCLGHLFGCLCHLFDYFGYLD
jgi:hypothetical protein